MTISDPVLEKCHHDFLDLRDVHNACSELNGAFLHLRYVIESTMSVQINSEIWHCTMAFDTDLIKDFIIKKCHLKHDYEHILQ